MAGIEPALSITRARHCLQIFHDLKCRAPSCKFIWLESQRGVEHEKSDEKVDELKTPPLTLDSANKD